MIGDAQAYLAKLGRFALKRDLVLSLSVALCVVVGGVFLGWYNNEVVLTNPAVTAHYNEEPTNQLSFMSNWDGPNYLSIEQHGYTSVTQTNFFPLYPLITRLVNVVISSPLDSALAVAWLSFVGAIYFYLRIIKLIFAVKANSEALRGVLLFILFPTAVFFLATYTESLFAFLALGAICHTLRKNYLPAALFLLLVTATHVTGVFVLALVAMMLLEQRAKIISLLGTAVVGSLGLLSYMYFLLTKFHRPFGFISSQVKGHGWLQHGFSNLLTTVDLVNVIFIILLVLAAVYWWRSRKSFSIYSLLFLLIPLVGKQFGGFNRYVLVAFPVELMFYGYLKNKKLGYPIAMTITSIVWVYFLFQYAGGYVGG